MSREQIICGLLHTYDPYGMKDTEPCDLTTWSNEQIISNLYEWYVEEDGIDPNDKDFLNLIEAIRLAR